MKKLNGLVACKKIDRTFGQQLNGTVTRIDNMFKLKFHAISLGKCGSKSS